MTDGYNAVAREQEIAALKATLAERNAELHVAIAQAQEWRAALTTAQAEAAALRAEVEALRVVNVPPDLVEQVLDMGRVEWGATAEKTASEHIADFAETLRITREHFNYEDVPVANHGVYLAGTETVLCHTGTSPNSGQNARVLVGLWNQFHDALAARTALEPQP